MRQSDFRGDTGVGNAACNEVANSERKCWDAVEGSPFPLGVSWIEAERAYNFSLYSKHAESVTLLLYGPDNVVKPLLTHPFHHLENKSGRIWHCRIPETGMQGARYYAYAIRGPAPQGRFERHAFDPEKVLLDPYARSIFFPATFDRQAAMHPGSNAGKAALGLLGACRDTFDWDGDRRPRHTSDTIIYELHVRGFTQRANSGVSPDERGTYLGVIEKIPYLQELGITAVELMPVFQYDPQEGNYWGYMPINFFAPHHDYASARGTCEQRNEFCAMVKALHAADIEVILDVVYNHTGESDHLGPTYSYRGIDNSTYYLVSDDVAEPYANFSGTGNTLHCGNRYVRRMILDSLRYWVNQMHVDGFRFDLVSVFTRNADASINCEDPALLGAIRAEPALDGIRLIAEPWDAAGAYQLGRGFPGVLWSQWNGRFRDDVRRFLRGDPGLIGVLMNRLYGSDDLFPDDRTHAYHPYQSINYVTSHDGSTLYDLLSYSHKRNGPNGHANTDGLDEEFSWNCGWEGDEDVSAAVTDLRKRQAKNFCALLLLSNGTPMLRAGDELLQTQGGNNNPYNQDNETSWIDWDRLRFNRDVFRFFQRMIAFRKAHPSLSRSRFWREDVHWYGVGPNVDFSYDSRALAVCLHGASQSDDDLYVMINMYGDDLPFTVQEGLPAQWQRVVDTGQPSPDDFCEPNAAAPLISPTCVVKARSVVVLLGSRT